MITKLPRETEMVGRLVTLGLQRTSAARWKISRTVLNVAQTVNSPPTQPQSQQLNSGRHFFFFSDYPFLQGLWLEKPEPKPFVHLDRLLTGEVATGVELDLWKHHHDVHQRTARACQIGVSNNETAKRWTPVISYTGNVPCHDQLFEVWQWIFAFKGVPTVRRLWKRHCHCDSLLWRLNCLWYHTIIFSYLDQFLKTVNKILWVVILTINSTQKYVSIDFFKYQSSRDLRRWPGWTSYQALVGSVDSAWGSASSPSLRSSTGSPSGFAGPWCHTMTDSESTFKLRC